MNPKILDNQVIKNKSAAEDPHEDHLTGGDLSARSSFKQLRATYEDNDYQGKQKSQKKAMNLTQTTTIHINKK